MATTRVRSATEADLQLILDFIRGLAEYEKLGHECIADIDTLRRFLFDTPTAEVLIAELDGVAAGFALYFSSFSTFLGRPGIYLEDLFVRPESRGHGVGRALLERLARTAIERDYGRLEWSVLDWNRPAIDFYEGLGARPVEGWTRYRVSDEALVALGGGSR